MAAVGIKIEHPITEAKPCGKPITMSVSERASPTGATTGGRSWTCRSPSRLPSKPVRNPSRSHEVATGRMMSA